MASKIREATYSAGVHEVFVALESVVRRLGMEIVYGNPQAGALRFKAGMSAFSWGEDLDALVQPSGPGTVKVLIRSGLKFGLVDWGRNNKNLERIFAALDAQLTSAAPGTPAGPEAPLLPPPPLPPPSPPSPSAPPPPSPSAPPPYAVRPTGAGWQPDPAGRHQERLWDGDRWTPHVRDGDVVGVDPYEPPGIG